MSQDRSNLGRNMQRLLLAPPEGNSSVVCREEAASTRGRSQKGRGVIADVPPLPLRTSVRKRQRSFPPLPSVNVAGGLAERNESTLPRATNIASKIEHASLITPWIG